MVQIKKTKVYTINLLIIVLFFNCNYNTIKKLENYPKITKIFNYSEIQDLDIILTFFDTKISNEFKSSSIKESYSSYYRKSLNELDNGSLYIGFLYNEQIELINKIKKSTFKEIWNKGENFSKNDTLDLIYLRTDGKYAEFLKILGDENIAIKKYINDLTLHNDITPEQSYFFLNNYKSIDINDERIRLVLAIHYLTLSNIYGERN